MMGKDGKKDDFKKLEETNFNRSESLVTSQKMDHQVQGFNKLRMQIVHLELKISTLADNGAALITVPTQSPPALPM